MRKGHGYTKKSLNQRLEAIKRIPIFPKTEKLFVVLGGSRPNILSSVEGIAENERSEICFLSLKDKSDAMFKTLTLLSEYKGQSNGDEVI